jgi:hypothetical protein
MVIDPRVYLLKEFFILTDIKNSFETLVVLDS